MIRVLLVTLSVLMLSAPALACQCIPFESPQRHVEYSELIFEGVAKTTTRGLREYLNSNEWAKPGDHWTETTFTVTRVLKGDVPKEYSVRHMIWPCPTEFRIGAFYRIFVARDDDGQLFADGCLQPHFEWAEYEAVLKQQALNEQREYH